MPNSRDPELSLDSEVTAAFGTTQKNKIEKQEDASRKQILVQSFWILIMEEAKKLIQWGSLYSFVKGI